MCVSAHATGIRPRASLAETCAPVVWSPRQESNLYLALRTTTAFAAALRVCGLDYAFAMTEVGRQEPSSLYTFPQSGLGSALPRDGPRGFTEFDSIQPVLSRPSAH